MIKSDWYRRRAARRLGMVLALVGGFAAVSCDKKGGHEHQHTETFEIETKPEFDRPLNQIEADSLRAMMFTHRVARDEYWDMKGGVLANDRVEVWYSDRKIYVLQAMAVLKQMDLAADAIQKSFGRLPEGRLVVVCAPDLTTFRDVTGLDWWHYAETRGDTLNLQTPMTLHMRGLLHSATRREYSRWALTQLTGGKAPEWVVWGMASYFANERDIFRGQRKEYTKLDLRADLKEIEKQLGDERDRILFRRALYNAYLMVNQLVQTHGMPSVAAFVLAIGEENSLDAAARRAFSKSYEEVVAEARSWPEPVEPAQSEADSTAPAAAGHDHAGEQ